jgi:hypothetical protein
LHFGLASWAPVLVLTLLLATDTFVWRAVFYINVPIGTRFLLYGPLAEDQCQISQD